MNKMGVEISQEIKEKGATLVGEAVKRAIAEIDKRMSKPSGADEVARIGFLSKLYGAADPHIKEIGKERWKNAKAVGAGVLSILPIIGQVEGGGVAVAELTDAAILEGATLAEAGALAGGKVVGAGGTVVETLGKMMGNKSLEGVKKAMKAIDPFEDVPIGITSAAAAVELLGVEGAMVIPAVARLGIGAVKICKEGIAMGKDMYGVIKDEINNRTKKAGSPGMGAAAAVFA